MIPYFDSGKALLYQADAQSIPLPDESVHCCVTSPPYWSLRDYGLPPSVWGGDPACAHEWGDGIEAPGSYKVDNKEGSTRVGPPNPSRQFFPQSAFCRGCGAWRGSLGLEPTPELYVRHIVGILREVWRVLRKDGVLFLNLGDSYGSVAPRGHYDHQADLPTGVHGELVPKRDGSVWNLKPKDLVGMPFRVAQALQADGWWWRSPIIWAKDNPTPESVEDRPTNAHEYIWLMTKSGAPTYWTHRDLPGTRTAPPPDWRWTDRATGIEYQSEPSDWSGELIDCPECGGEGEIRITVGQASMFDGPPMLVKICPRCNHSEAETPGQIRRWRRINLWRGHDYFFDADAVRTPSKDPTDDVRRIYGQTAAVKSAPSNTRSGLRPRSDKQRGHSRRHTGFNERWDAMNREEQQAMGANVRTVWRIAARPFPESHFATFPEELAGRCIQAGTSERGVCGECGAPWERTVDRKFKPQSDVSLQKGVRGAGNQKPMGASNEWDGFPRGTTETHTTGWQPTCACDADVIPATVLDPFIGSGTTCVVAQKLGRGSVGTDLSETYLEMATRRIAAVTIPGALATR